MWAKPESCTPIPSERNFAVADVCSPKRPVLGFCNRRPRELLMNGTDQISHKGTETLPSGVAPEQHPAVRVLAVDDEPAAARLLSLILPPPAFRCATAACGEEALVALQREPFDAIISDLQMPGLSGLDLLAEVRRNHPYLAFLVTTGVDDVDVGVKAMRCGADDYLVKPLRESAVLASLENALHKRRLEQELER